MSQNSNNALIYQIFSINLFLIFISIEFTYGCISLKHEKFNQNGNSKYISLHDMLQNIQHDTNYNEEREILFNFQNFLVEQYNFKFTKYELKILWSALKKFSIERSQSEEKPKGGMLNKSKSKLKQNYITNKYIDEYLESHSSLTLKQLSVKQRSSNHGTRLSQDSEILAALGYYKNTFKKIGCKPYPHLLCGKKYFDILHKSRIQIFQVVPPGYFVDRCSKCSCLEPTKVCLPTAIRFFRADSAIVTSGNTITEALILVNHTKCSCQDRCTNRTCINPFELVNENSDCRCGCKPGMNETCSNILEGKAPFQESDYNCIIKGTCLSPECKYGVLDEEYLYAKRCPPKTFR